MNELEELSLFEGWGGSESDMISAKALSSTLLNSRETLRKIVLIEVSEKGEDLQSFNNGFASIFPNLLSIDLDVGSDILCLFSSIEVPQLRSLRIRSDNSDLQPAMICIDSLIKSCQSTLNSLELQHLKTFTHNLPSLNFLYTLPKLH